ncbi:hypothetical protein JTE90_025839 [Oedothorax gibbosus]|uniref:Carboxylic ester hydrolase n=1 Tax=Oedothorax gibbosus TaxID=931172 RepID=A0AAV6UWX4_9ARAC|nr:hypothetical protein JTE90_025839 [Oedothorax gibbosus]
MTSTGPLQGVTVSTDGPLIEAFLGVPYAEPPLGRLRFNKPVPKTPWNGVYDASSQYPTCIQNVTGQHYWEPNIQNMTEDCLYLNLWVPYTKEPTELKTIIVFVHGGAFNLGSGNMKLYEGVNLAKFGDVIVANLNYRVGALGFFSAFIEEANGNMGALDQILATRWIKDNAKSFGGDPDKIVLMGESAGSMITAGHLTSPMAKNLFKRVIMQSGASTLPMILDENKRLYDTSQNLAYLVGCADEQFTIKDYPRQVLECLKRIPAHELAIAEGRIKEKNPITFLPRVGDDYMPKPCIKALQDGDFLDVEMLTGISEEEGTFFLTVAAPEYFGTYGQNRVSRVSRRFAMSVVNAIFTTFPDQRNEKEIADQYINSVVNGTSDSYAKAIAMSLGDYLINCNVLFHAELHSMRNPVYFYVFGRRGSSSPTAEWMGITHFDELQYVFGNPLFGNFTPKEVEFSHRMMARIVAFAKTGNPNIPGEIEWPRFKYGDPEYIFLNDKEIVKTRPDNFRCEFWRDRYQAQMSDEIISKIKYTINSGNFLTANMLTISSVTLALTFLIHKTYYIL